MSQRVMLTPPEIARQWGVSADKIVAWIRAGELRAIDVSARRGGRPRYRVRVEDLELFAARRAVVPAMPVRRRRRAMAGVTEYF